MKPIIADPPAEAEIFKALTASRNAVAFQRAIDAAGALITANPGIGAPVGRLGVRRYILTRYPYSLIYREERFVIRVYAFAHHKRTRYYWKSRLRP